MLEHFNRFQSLLPGQLHCTLLTSLLSELSVPQEAYQMQVQFCTVCWAITLRSWLQAWIFSRPFRNCISYSCAVFPCNDLSHIIHTEPWLHWISCVLCILHTLSTPTNVGDYSSSCTHLFFQIFDPTNYKSYIMIGYCSFQMTTESNCLQILCQFFNQREAKLKLIAHFIIQLDFVECSNNTQDEYKYHTVFVLLRTG